MPMLADSEVKKLEKLANLIRQDIIKMLLHAGSGHSAGPLGMADIFSALYFHILNHNPSKPDSKERDRLILSNGHICPVLYASLARAGYFPLSELSSELLEKYGLTKEAIIEAIKQVLRMKER